MSWLRMFFSVVLLPIAVADLQGRGSQPSLDLFGDPLPPGAVTCLGTMRLRNAFCMAFSSDGKTIATAKLHIIHLWDAETGKPLQRFAVPRSSEWAHTIAISPDGRKVAVLGNLSCTSSRLPQPRVRKHRRRD